MALRGLDVAWTAGRIAVRLDRWRTCRGTISIVTVPVHDVLAESRAALRIGDATGGATAHPCGAATLATWTT